MQVGLPGLLFVTFLVLKLTGVIAWSWLWVTSPLWIPLALALLWIPVALILAGVTARSARGALDRYSRSLR